MNLRGGLRLCVPHVRSIVWYYAFVPEQTIQIYLELCQ